MEYSDSWVVTLTYDGGSVDMALMDSWEDDLADFAATAARVPEADAVDLHLHVGAMPQFAAMDWATAVAARVTGRVPAQVSVCPERVWLAGAADEAMSDADRRRALRSKWDRAAENDLAQDSHDD